MALGAYTGRQAPDEFSRFHRLFVQHLSIAVALVWLSSAYAGLNAPWLRNFRGLIDPFGRPESTASFLFGLPLILTIALGAAALGGEALRRGSLLRNQALEFALAGAVAFAIFCLAIDRAVTVVLFAR